MTAKYTDAIGYLNELSQDINKDWFRIICDITVTENVSILDQQNIEILLALFKNQASYISNNPGTPSVFPIPIETPSNDFLETLQFSHFKMLADTLEFALTKPITVVFGTNGSGKSSVCEALKILASPNRPIRPLHNVRNGDKVPGTFNYKFRTDTAPQTWSADEGYGVRTSIVKYFDTGIALQNVESAVDPGRVIELTPFKLHVFETTKELTTNFRDEIQKLVTSKTEELSKSLETLQLLFKDFKNYPIASISEKDLSKLTSEITIGEVFDQQNLLEEKIVTQAELQKAISIEGMKLLKAEHKELKDIHTSLQSLIDSAEELWEINPADKADDLKANLLAQELLGKKLIPEDETLEGFMPLLRAASTLCNLDAEEQKNCPLCKQELSVREIELFKQYHNLVNGELEDKISKIRTDLVTAKKLVKEAHLVDYKDWDLSGIFPPELITDTKASVDLIVSNCKLDQCIQEEAHLALESIKLLNTKMDKLISQKGAAIKSASESKEEALKLLASINTEIEPMRYAQILSTHLTELNELQLIADEYQFWIRNLPFFKTVLKKITDAAKEAYEQLVVTDFETRLDNEYKALTERPMSAFGVQLVKKGSDASVTVLPKIGGNEIGGVMSEGEQRIHALALFFAELETCQQVVIVFDDPISSFDYNYIGNYCIRVRDFALSHPTHQIIVLTHNWEFFVQLQMTLNHGHLNGQLSVKVLENCSVVGDYSEKIDALNVEISAILSLEGEPTKSQKEELAGKMRRLIEAIVNTYAFNGQRHQFKQKSQQVSQFDNYTKLVPLLPNEATTLSDLYSKLSISEHDDPRNAYVNTDKTMFQTRYERILSVAGDIQIRRAAIA